MIKSPEKQYNAYRILKVLANQDYLAVDYSHAYYVLSPVKTRYNLKPKTRSSQNCFDDIPKVLKPKECIQIDRIHYYVFFIGQHQVICANNFESAKIKNPVDLLAFFKGAVEQILKHILMKDAKQVRRIIDVKNCIIVKTRLYLLELDRGKIFPRSLQKSQRLLMRGNQDDSFRKILQNQLRIIKYFGLMMWQIIYKTPYLPKRLNMQVNEEETFLKRLLVDMVSKNITYEYICIRIKEEERKAAHWKDKKVRKINTFIKKNLPRYRTESLNSNCSLTPSLSRMNTESHKENTPLIDHRKIRISHIKTGEDSIQTFQSGLPRLNQRRLKFTSIYRSTGQNSSFRDSKPKISAETHEKLSKQSEVARNLFNRFVQARFNLRRENDDEIGQNLRFKLISKIQRFKTEHKSHSREKDDNFYLSQKNVVSNMQCYESLEPITKKLDFTQYTKQEGASLKTTAINLNTTPRQDRQKQGIAQPISEIKTAPKQEIKKESKKQQQQVINTVKQDVGQIEEQIQFQVINLSNILQNHQNMREAVNQSASKTDQSDKHQIRQKVQMDERRQKLEQIQRRNNIISQQKQSSDQIEVITIKKTTIEKPHIQQNKPSLKPQLTKPKPLQINIDRLIGQIGKYESLISILGDISTRAIRIKQQLSAVEWRRPVYFIYQRFIYQRSKFEQALLLGARQIIRKSSIHKDDQWDEWQKSNHRKQLIVKIQEENRLVKGIFNSFASKVPFQCKFQRKIDYYIRNRQKLGLPQQAKIRNLLVKFTAKYVIEIYNTIIDNEVSSKQLLNFLQDCLYACLIIGELDGRVPETKWVKINEYQKYSGDLDTIDLQVELLYNIYFNSQSQQNAQG